MYALRTIFSYYTQKVQLNNNENNVIKKNNVDDEKKPFNEQPLKYKDYTTFDNELSIRIEKLMKSKSD